MSDTPAPASVPAPQASAPASLLGGSPPPAAPVVPASSAPPAVGDAGTPPPAAGAAAAQAFSLYAEGGLHPDLAKIVADDKFKGARSVLTKYAKAENPTEALLVGLSNLNYMASQKGLEPLPADAPDSVRADFDARFRKLTGAPDKPEGYGIKPPEGSPDAVFSKAYTDGIAGILHKHAASPALAAELVKFDQEHGAKAMAQAREGAVVAARSELATVYGAKLDQALVDAERGLDIAAGLTGIKPDQLRSAATNNPTMIRVLAALKAATAEDSRVGEGNVSGAKSYLEQADAIMTDATHPLHADWKSGDSARVARAGAERQRLIKLHLATGGKA